MFYSVLATGSKANSTIVYDGTDAILFDCGLSCKQTCVRIAQLGIDPGKIRAIFVSHEHSDHIRGISVLSRKFQIPVYCVPGVERFLGSVYHVEPLMIGEELSLGKFTVRSFPIVHDALDPVAFTVHRDGVKLGVVTDLGRVTAIVKSALLGVNALLLEANYDPELLYSCHYPWSVKQRISSTHGHLSNDESATLLEEIESPDLFHVVLGHLSENSNSREAVFETFHKRIDVSRYYDFMCGTPYQHTRLIEIGKAGGMLMASGVGL